MADCPESHGWLPEVWKRYLVAATSPFLRFHDGSNWLPLPSRDISRWLDQVILSITIIEKRSHTHTHLYIYTNNNEGSLEVKLPTYGQMQQHFPPFLDTCLSLGFPVFILYLGAPLLQTSFSLDTQNALNRETSSLWSFAATARATEFRLDWSHHSWIGLAQSGDERERERNPEPQPPFGPSVRFAMHESQQLTSPLGFLSFGTSATALCGTTGINGGFLKWGYPQIIHVFFFFFRIFH